ncbi:MAG: hypothetical protein JXA49_03530 [Actinobacteria bacterium]|nr:hypothetical protein [Actinomycetota bacterium]
MPLSAILKLLRELAAIFSVNVTGSLPPTGRYETSTLTSEPLGFWMSSHVSNPQLELPPGRYQVLAGAVTPTYECPSGEATPPPVHSMVRSTAIAFVLSIASTLVEK